MVPFLAAVAEYKALLTSETVLEPEAGYKQRLLHSKCMLAAQSFCIISKHLAAFSGSDHRKPGDETAGSAAGQELSELAGAQVCQKGHVIAFACIRCSPVQCKQSTDFTIHYRYERKIIAM